MSRYDRAYLAGKWVAQEARKAQPNVTASADWVDDEVEDLIGRCAHAGRTLTFVLPMPPSVNDLYGINFKTGQKFLRMEQREFRNQVIGIVEGMMLKTKPLLGRLSLTITYYFANRRRADVSNRRKALEDALEHAGAFIDDSQIDEEHGYRVIRPNGPEECVVQLRELA